MIVLMPMFCAEWFCEAMALDMSKLTEGKGWIVVSVVAEWKRQMAVHTVMGDESIVEGLSDNTGCIGIIFVRNLILRCASGLSQGYNDSSCKLVSLLKAVLVVCFGERNH